MTASPDFGHLGPMLAAARRELANAGVTKPPDVVVADAGYWHLEQINEITGDGIPVLIPPDSSRRANKPKRPGWNGGAYDFMRSVLSTELGSKLYRQRAQLIEPIFGDTKHNRGFTRFARRGRSAARTEWRLMATTHNLLKLHQHFTGRARAEAGLRRPYTSAGKLTNEGSRCSCASCWLRCRAWRWSWSPALPLPIHRWRHRSR
jgi:hypothetical protein